MWDINPYVFEIIPGLSFEIIVKSLQIQKWASIGIEKDISRCLKKTLAFLNSYFDAKLY